MRHENELFIGSDTPPRITVHALAPPPTSTATSGVSGTSYPTTTTSATTMGQGSSAMDKNVSSGLEHDKESYSSGHASGYVPSSRAGVGGAGVGLGAGVGASAIGAPQDKSSYPAAAGGPLSTYSSAVHPVSYDPNRVSGINLRPGIVFPSGDVPRMEPGEATMDIAIFALLFAGLIVIAAVAEWSATSPGRTGFYFGSMWLVLVGLIGWLAAFWFGWTYARDSITVSYAIRFLWIGMIIGAIEAAIEWGAVIEPLGFQYEQWHLNGVRFSHKNVAHIILLKALVLPLIEQGLILAALYWGTTRRDNRLWRPYSYLILAVCLEVGAWAAEQVIVYSSFPAWHQTSGGFLTNGEVARGVFGEALFFLFVGSMYFVVAGLLAGASRAIHQLNDKEQVELAHVADLPPELFPGPLAASMLLLMMVFLRGFFEVFRLVILTQGGQEVAPTKAGIVAVYLLLGIIGLMLLRHRLRATLPVIFLLDPLDYYGSRNRASTVGAHRV